MCSLAILLQARTHLKQYTTAAVKRPASRYVDIYISSKTHVCSRTFVLAVQQQTFGTHECNTSISELLRSIDKIEMDLLDSNENRQILENTHNLGLLEWA